MRLTFRCKRKKAKYGETFMRALKDLQQPIMLSAYKKCIFLILRDLKIFEFNTLSHLMTNKKNLGSLKTTLTGNDSDLAWGTNDHHILHSKVPTKVMHERYSQAMITIFNFWSYLAPSMNTLAQWSADIFFDTWSFCNGSAPQLNFGALITDYERVKKQICLQYIPQLMSHLNMMVCLCLILV